MSLQNESPAALGNDWSLRRADQADAEFIAAIFASHGARRCHTYLCFTQTRRFWNGFGTLSFGGVPQRWWFQATVRRVGSRRFGTASRAPLRAPQLQGQGLGALLLRRPRKKARAVYACMSSKQIIRASALRAAPIKLVELCDGSSNRRGT